MTNLQIWGKGREGGGEVGLYGALTGGSQENQRTDHRTYPGPLVLWGNPLGVWSYISTMMDESPPHPSWSLKSLFGSGCSQWSFPQSERKTLQILHKKFIKNLRDEIKEQNNQSHPPFSVQVTSQCGCHFTPAVK